MVQRKELDLNAQSNVLLIDRIRANIFPVDYLVLIYGLFMTLINLIFYRQLGESKQFLTTDLCILIILSVCVYFERRDFHSQLYWIHVWMPVLTFAMFYTQSTVMDNLIFSQTFDPLLKKLDLAIFGTSLNSVLAPAINSGFIDELMHFFYFSYYFLLFIPGLIMLLRRNPLVYEMIFNLTLMAYAHYLFFMIFPADGPLNERPLLFPRGVIFIPLEDFIYKASGQQGGGAFPSTHVATAVIVFLYSLKHFKKSNWIIGFIVIGITLATVYCSYHYAIDALAGIVTGLIFYFIGHRFYSTWRHPSELPFEEEPPLQHARSLF